MINTIILGHALNVLPQLPAESVNCCVCSPPYWSLRDYGVEPVVWDGDKNCKHNFSEYDSKLLHENRQNLDGGTSGNPKYRENLHGFGNAKAGFCSKCGAWSGSLGLEPNFELYIEHLCQIFDQVKRVLKKDGTCWINIGDSYGGSGNASGHTKDTKNLGYKTLEMGATQGNQRTTGQYAKSLLDIPYRFSIEMINRGWIKRNTIIWWKPNCMPSSAKDRFTVDFEYVYFFVKSKRYWFEQQFEEHMTQENGPDGIVRNRIFNYDSKLNKLRGFKTKQIEEEIQGPQYHGKDINYGKQGRNKRAVWTIPTQPFPEAHFAVYPETLIEPMIKAGCPEFVCKKCGKARVKIYRTKVDPNKVPKKWRKTYRGKVELDGSPTKRSVSELYAESLAKERTVEGYSDCGCNAGWESGITLDPFMGVGTTALVALKQRKRFIGIEIKQGYIDMSNKRIARIQQEIF